MTLRSAESVPSGIAPLDERIGGLERGGTYLVVGAPGPAKMVAALQFLSAGLERGETALLITTSDAQGIIDVASAWGASLLSAWEEGRLQILGFRDDFELRAIRSIEPDEVLEELDELTVGEPDLIAVDPGAMFLAGGAKTLLGAAFLAWADERPATVLATYSVDGDATSLPASADWLIGATRAHLVVRSRSGGLHEITHTSARPEQADQTVTLELSAGRGLVHPGAFPSRRGADRGDVDRNRLLLVTLDESHAADLGAWASQAFDTDIVSQPFDAVTRVQMDSTHGCVLVHAPRRRVREAVQACLALRPLTRAVIVFASDDAIRSTDRIHILEAGADDCLSGGLDFRELGLRIRQSMATGAKPIFEEGLRSRVVEEITGGIEGGPVSRELFRDHLVGRAADADRSYFCVLELRSGTLSPVQMEEELADLVRSEEGDLVSRGPDHCLALLQGAREQQLGPLLDRLRGRMESVAGGAADLEVRVLGHPRESEKIEELLGAFVGEQG